METFVDDGVEIDAAKYDKLVKVLLDTGMADRESRRISLCRERVKRAMLRLTRAARIAGITHTRP